MIFLAPTVLAGLGAIAAPVVIHLLNRRRTQVIPWAAMRFLLATAQRHKRSFDLEQWLLLLLRCLVVVCLALAFARPVLHPGGGTGDGAGGPTIAVLLLDQSASMGQSNGLQTRFEQAKSRGREILDALAPGSQAALFLVANRVNPVVPRPTANLTLVRRSLDLAEPTVRTNDYLTAIKQALDTLRPINGAGKEIDLLTDNQASAWQDLDAIRAALALSPEVRFKVVGLGERGEDNLAITAVQPDSAAPAAGQLVGCQVQVSNHSAAPAAGVRVTLSVDNGPPVDETTVERIEPGQSRAVRLSARFPKAGFYVLNAAIPPDRFPADDQRALAVHVLERREITVVEGGAAATPQERDAFFLANALVPVPPARRADYYLKVAAVQPSWLATADLARSPLILLADVAAPDPATSQKLLKYVQDGGSLVVFPGSRVQPDAYNNDPALRALLPAKIGTRIDAARDGKLAAWQARDYHHPVTALWNDPANGNLGTVRASQYFPLTPSDAAQVVVSYADGAPAVVARACGKGKVVLFGVPATTRWSNLPIHPDFVPLLRRLVDFLSSDPAGSGLAVAPGGVFQQVVNGDLAGRELTIVRPGGVTRPAGKVELVGQEAVVRYRDTEQAGGYRLKAAGEDATVAAFAVDIDPQESDLKTVDPAKLAPLSADQPARAATASASAPAAGAVGGSAGVRRELWLALLCAAGVAALG
ncbi:MAG: BatA domain-containing protein, partial [Gluconacetobacter diazotrophicus]|nr:BatA domain-containing protein [Gluconacetobacter diazotrophicus]